MGGGGGKFIMVDRGGGGGTCAVDMELMEGGGGMAVVGGRCVSGFSSCGTFGPIRSLSSEGLGTTEKVRSAKHINFVTHQLRYCASYSLVGYSLVAIFIGCVTSWLG